MIPALGVLAVLCAQDVTGATAQVSRVAKIREPRQSMSTTAEAKAADVIHHDPATADNHRTLIAGGVSAHPSRYPYMVSLRFGSEHVCGGTLVAPDVVLTAAHCSNLFDVAEVGRYNLSDLYEPYLHGSGVHPEVHIVEKTVLHPGFAVKQSVEGNTNFDMDFALVKIYGESSAAIRPVRLNSNPNALLMDGDSLSVLGWGAEGDETSSEKGKGKQKLLQQAQLEYVPNEACEHAKGILKSSFDEAVNHAGNSNPQGTYDDQIGPQMMCAESSKGRSVCQGDNGGPLIMDGGMGSADVQVGIASFGFGCTGSNGPSVYSRISDQYEWIRNTICELSSSAPAYLECPNTNGLEKDEQQQQEQTKERDSSDTKKTVSVAIALDDFPWEQGFVVTSLHDDKVHAYYPVGSFVLEDQMALVKLNLELENNQAYRFVLMDTKGDGIRPDWGGFPAKYMLYSGPNQSGDLLFSGEGDFEFYREHSFVLGSVPNASLPQIAPPVPSFQGQIEKGNYLTVSIHFDSKPLEVAWVVTDVDSQVVMSSHRSRYYGTSFANQEIQELIGLYDRSEGPRDYLITFLDAGGDGLCCSRGEGSYEIYWGPMDDGNLLLSGAEGYGMEQWLLTVTEGDGIILAVPPSGSSGKRLATNLINAVILAAVTVLCFME